jgi:hypothetical protein
MITNDTVKKSRLARAIGADQADDFALIDLEGDMVVGHHTAKVFDKFIHFKKCHAMHPFFETVQ